MKYYYREKLLEKLLGYNRYTNNWKRSERDVVISDLFSFEPFPTLSPSREKNQGKNNALHQQFHPFHFTSDRIMYFICFYA